MGDRLPRKLAAILYADVAGYSRLTGEDEEGTHRRLSEYLDVFTTKIQNLDGKVVHFAGDAILAEFSTVSDALACAASVQRDLADRNEELADERKVQFRIGLNLGEIIVDRDDIYGDGVNIAARLESLAEPGGICVSEAVRSSIGNKLPVGFEFLGEQRVKNIAEPVRAYHVWLKPGAELPEPAEQWGSVEPTAAPRRWRPIAAAIAIVLITVAGALMWLKPWEPQEDPASVERMLLPLPEKPSIAVLPFDILGIESEQDYLGDGLTNDIITALSNFANLFVIASHSSFAYKNKPVKVQTVSEELGVRYVLKGSIQKSIDKVRINAQLIDALSGRHLWAERYDRQTTDLLVIQDEIVESVVANLAIQVDVAERERANAKQTNSLEAYDYYLRADDIRWDWEEATNDQARQLLDKAIELDPSYARAYSALAWTHVNDWRWGWTDDPEASKKLALEAARKAAELDPFDPESYHALGVVHLYARNFDKAIPLYEKAVALNPNNARRLVGTAPAWIYVGRTEEAVAQIERALRLNPHHSDNDLNFLGWAYYEAEEYEKALATLKTVEQSPWHGVLAATYVRLGRMEEAREEVVTILKNDPEYSIEKGKIFPYKYDEQRKHYYDALAEAGVPEHPPLLLPDKPSIAVLPFTNMSDDTQQEYFADGITDDLITDLAKISGLFVISRNSSFAYRDKSPDVRQVAQALGVKYVLEGSVRRAGDEVRINTQLIDASTGGHLWAERYDGALSDVFSLQDRVIARIVSALKITLTDTEQAQLVRMPTNNLEAYDYYMRAARGFHVYNIEGRREALQLYQKAIGLDPEFAEAYAGIARVASYVWRWEESSLLPGPVARNVAYQAASKALKLDPGNAQAYSVLALLQMTEGRHDEALESVRTAISLQPNDVWGYASLAHVLVYAGQHVDALNAMQTAFQLEPRPSPELHANMGWVLFWNRRYEEAIGALEKALEGGVEYFNTLAMTYAELGRLEEARAMVAEIHERFPGANLSYYRALYASRHKRAVDLDQLIDALRKAGIPEWPMGYAARLEDRLDSATIETLVFGRTWAGHLSTNDEPFVQEFDKDGKVGFRGADSLLAGTAWLEDGMLCVDFPALGVVRKSCGYLYRNPKGNPEEQNEYTHVGIETIVTFSISP